MTHAPHFTDHPHLEVRNIPGKGRGVFATKDIEPGTALAVFCGPIIICDDALALPPSAVNHAIQCGPKSFVWSLGYLAECFNHSCSPNCGIRNLTEIFAVDRILAGTECVWDYRLSENSTWELKNCICGSLDCAGTVRNYNSLPMHKKEEYLFRGMVSEWIIWEFSSTK